MGGREEKEAWTAMLRKGCVGPDDVSGVNCPEPEILASYFERSLSSTEQARYEEHFSNCVRCQAQLAALARSEPEPEPRREWLKDWRHAWGQPEPVAARPAAAPAVSSRIKPEPEQRRPWPTDRRRAWRWLVPAGAIVAAFAIWVVVHSPEPELRRRIASTKQVAVATPAQSNPAEEINQFAPSAVPAATPHESGAKNLSRKKSPVEKPAARSPARFVPGAPGRSVNGPFSAGVGGAQAIGSTDRLALSAKTPETKTEKVEMAANPEQREKLVSKQRIAAEEAAPPPSASEPKEAPLRVLPVPRIATENVESNAVARRKASRPPAQFPAALALREVESSDRSVFFSQDGKTGWRLGPSGVIERTRDHGRTWQGQFADGKESLLDGSSPSADVCWVVGRAGTVLRTTDGERWQRVVSPAAVDLTRVFAQGAQNATVVAADGRVFSTKDGGQTWQPEMK